MLPDSAYLVDLASGALRLVAPFDTLTTLVIAYRSLPRVLAPAPLPRFEEPEPDSTRTQRRSPPGPLARAPNATASTVTTSGSITRGVVAGSNRDVSLTSGLRLDIGGEIAPGVTVSGALTDSDTPIVPEGTTQTLSDFDRVFVRVDGPGANARLGDIDLALDGTSFAPLRRKVQGAAFSLDVPARGWISGGRVEAGASAVRGRFRSQDLILLESVQGPYRLEGDRGEPFVLVVPGSERVYWDGRPLARGRDYTVDYGTGEVTFTAENLVTAERRATVDFEYSAGGYARTLSVAGAKVDLGRTARGGSLGTLGVRLLREADAPGLGDALGLSESDLDLIAGAGDRDVLVPGETRVPFEPESATLLYTARDTTLASGATVRIFVPASADADSCLPRPLLAREARAGELSPCGTSVKWDPLRVRRNLWRRLRAVPHPPAPRQPHRPRRARERPASGGPDRLRRTRAVAGRRQHALRSGRCRRRRDRLRNGSALRARGVRLGDGRGQPLAPRPRARLPHARPRARHRLQPALEPRASRHALRGLHRLARGSVDRSRGSCLRQRPGERRRRSGRPGARRLPRAPRRPPRRCPARRPRPASGELRTRRRGLRRRRRAPRLGLVFPPEAGSATCARGRAAHAESGTGARVPRADRRCAAAGLAAREHVQFRRRPARPGLHLARAHRQRIGRVAAGVGASGAGRYAR